MKNRGNYIYKIQLLQIGRRDLNYHMGIYIYIYITPNSLKGGSHIYKIYPFLSGMVYVCVI